MTVPTAPADAITPAYPGLDDPPVPAPPDEVEGPSWFFRSGNSVLRFLLALAVAAAIFSIFMIVKGVNPITAYGDMIHSIFRSPKQIGEIFIRATPILLAGLAVAIPARAGLINVGGEGQLIVGGIAAAGVALNTPGMSAGLVVLLMVLAAIAAGAAWAAIAAVLRMWVDINEAVTTLLLNYIALDLLGFLIYDPWKDANGSGQPTTPALASALRLPVIGDSRVHIGILIAVGLALVCWVVLKKTSWGFRLRVTGGNPEAARRAGMSVGLLLLSAMLVGGALAGLGGFAQYAGAEFKLRPGFCATYGYLGFLASWLAGHKPIGVVGAAVLLSAIAIGGDSLQIDSGLPAASVNILIALVLLAMFGLGRRKAVAA
jgi:general nucleoside transport system permease protein